MYQWTETLGLDSKSSITPSKPSLDKASCIPATDDWGKFWIKNDMDGLIESDESAAIDTHRSREEVFSRACTTQVVVGS